jgi:hypothetical protein
MHSFVLAASTSARHPSRQSPQELVIRAGHRWN